MGNNINLQVCTGKVCSSKFSEYIIKRVESDKDFYDLPNVKVEKCMCTGNCKVGPTVFFDKELHTRCSPSNVSKIMLEKIKGTYKKKQEFNNKKYK